MLHAENLNVRTGFVDPYYFSRLFKQKTGVTRDDYWSDTIRFRIKLKAT